MDCAYADISINTKRLVLPSQATVFFGRNVFSLFYIILFPFVTDLLLLSHSLPLCCYKRF